MINLVLVSDYTLNEYQGGAEMVDKNISSALEIAHIKSVNLQGIDPKKHYLVSNFLQISQEMKDVLIEVGNYSIFEHDYKIHPSRQPNRYTNNIFPREEIINKTFYEKAKNVFVQTKDHLECFTVNQIEANYTNLSTSIWSNEELNVLVAQEIFSKPRTKHQFAILDNPIVEKGTQNAANWCIHNTIDYETIPRLGHLTFLEKLSQHPALVYFPSVKESFCRVVVEARCLSMNVIAPKTFGAVKEPWFKLHGTELIEFLRFRSNENLETIKRLC
jgi:hypothetical protein